MERSPDIFKLLVETIKDYAIFLLDPNGLVRSWNQGAQRIKGYSGDEIVGKHFSVFYTSEDIAKGHPQFELKSALLDGRYEEEGWRVRKNGTHFLASVVITPLRSSEGALIGFAKMVRDLDEKKSIEETRSVQSEKQLKLIADALPSLIGYIDMSMRFRFANATYERWFGIPAREVIGKSFKELFKNEETVAFLTPYVERALRGETVTFATEVDYPLRGLRFVQVNYIPDRTSFGEIRGIVILVTDLTERRKMEKAEQFLNEITIPLSATLDYRKVIRVAADFCVPTLADWCVIDLLPAEDRSSIREVKMVPPVDERLLAVAKQYQPSVEHLAYPPTRAAFVGESVLIPDLWTHGSDVFNQSPEQAEAVRAAGIRSVISVPLVARGKVFGALTLMTSKSGRIFDDRDLSLAQEVARRVSLSIDNSQLFDRAKEAIEARDLFLSIASHELKNPITAMKIQSQLISRKMEKGGLAAFTPQQITQMADQIDRSLNRLTRLVEDMLDLSRIQTGKLAMKLEHVELTSLVKEVVSRVDGDLAATGMQVKLYASDEVWVTGDRFRMEQVVINIVTNAIRYAPGKPLEIFFKTTDGRVCVSFHDHGPGIPKAHQSVIFERYERVGAEPAGPGLGLGLYIVRQILEAHGGTIRVDSEQGKGATFTVELPLAEPASKVAFA